MKKHAIALCMTLAQAQEVVSSAKSYDLQASIITATKIPTTIDEAPGNVSVIDQKEINLRPNAKISDTLRGIEGLRQSKSRGMDTFDTITIRGISNGATIMLDGVILNDMDNNTKMIVSMNADDLKQVEVIRGPFSNLYGSGALAGALHFVTAMPKQFEAKAKIGYGNPFIKNTAQENLLHGYLSLGDVFFNQRLKIKLSYGFNITDGYAADSAWVYQGDSILQNATGGIPSKNPQGIDIYVIGDMGKQAYQTHDLKFKAQYDLNDSVTLEGGVMLNHYSYKHQDHTSFLKDQHGNTIWGNNSNTCSTNCSGGNNANRPLPIYFGRGIGMERDTQNIFYTGYKQYFDHFLLSARYSRIDGWRDWNNPDGGGKEQNADTTLTHGKGSNTKNRFQTNHFDLFANIPLPDLKNTNQDLIIGLQLRQLSMDETLFTLTNWTNYHSPKEGIRENKGGKSLSSGLFVELRSNWLDTLSTTIGLRYDYWLGYDYYKTNKATSNNSKHQISPKATINYNFTPLSLLKFSIGQGFRAPTMRQLFNEYKRNDGVSIIGNPHLKPESATSFDIGVEQKIAHEEYQGLFKAYYFNTFMHDIIYTDTTTKAHYLKNGGLALINGIEFSYKQAFPHHLSLLLTYTYTYSNMLKNPANRALEGKKLTGIPAHLGYIQIAYDDARFFGSFGIEMMSKPFMRADNQKTIGGVYSATDGYLLGDLRMGYYFLKRYEISANLTNIFNQKYFSYYRAPGAAFYLQFGATF